MVRPLPFSPLQPSLATIGIGLQVHESPYLRGGNDVVLSPGNVFSDEPAIYIEGKVSTGLTFWFHKLRDSDRWAYASRIVSLSMMLDSLTFSLGVLGAEHIVHGSHSYFVSIYDKFSGLVIIKGPCGSGKT
jgi:hypothetical protein